MWGDNLSFLRNYRNVFAATIVLMASNTFMSSLCSSEGGRGKGTQKLPYLDLFFFGFRLTVEVRIFSKTLCFHMNIFFLDNIVVTF